MCSFTCNCGFLWILRRFWLAFWTSYLVSIYVNSRTCFRILDCLKNWILSTLNMAAEKRCCVPNCSKNRSDNVILHIFPNPSKQADRFRSWVYAIGGDILAMKDDNIFKYRRVCHLHFEPKYYTWSKRLTPNAVPTLHLPGCYINVGFDHLPSTSTAKPNISLAPDEASKKTRLCKVFSSEASSLVRKIKKLRAEKDHFALKLKKALKLSENPTFQKAISKFTSAALILTLLQFREINKNKMGRRYSKKEKVLSLALYKQGPRAYRWLRNIFVLPSSATLSRMIARAALRPGINDNLFDVLSKKVKKMSETDKLCVLLFDEIAISPHFEYNRKGDIIKGFVNNGKKNIMKIADHALVFMVRGVQKNYKQPIYYTFCSGSTHKDELEIQIKEVIRKLKSVGLKVVATVCDQGTTNIGAIHNLIVKTKAHHLRKNSDWNKKTFEIDGDEIVPLFDPPHLIKSIRNNLLTKNLTYVIDNKKKIAKWDHIVQLYKENPAYQGIRLLPKLTEYHVNPKKIPKMKVKCATQVFSRSVAVNMGYLADKGILSNDCKDTADLLLCFDELFDSLNGSYENNKKRCGKSLLGALTPSSSHQVVWDNATPILKTMKFVSASTGTSACVPSIRNWLHTIENIKYLKTKLFKEHNLKSLWLRHFNQDPLENIFGSIRNHGARNVNPTSAGFEIAFASLLVNNLNNSHSPGANCEKDSCQPLKSLYKLFFSKKTQTNNVTTEINIDHINSHEILTDIYIKLSNPKIKAQLEYVSGYVLKKLKISFLKCKTCLTNLCDEKRSSEYIRLKDYSKEQKSLTHPSQEFLHLFSSIQDVVTYILRTSSNLGDIKNYFKTILCIVCNFNFITCTIHKNVIIEDILDITCRFFLHSWANNINKILKGARIDVDKDDVMQSQAFNYCLKRKNKLLNK